MANEKNKIFAGAANVLQPQCGEGIVITSLTVRPGALVEQLATGVRESDNADTDFGQGPFVALEKGVSFGSSDVDTVWAAGERAIYAIGRTGEFYNVRVAASQNITAPNTPLASNGDGTLKIAAIDGTDNILFYADEVVNVTTAGTLVRARVK